MPRPEFDIVVIGAGAGGLVVAAGGAALGAKVALVEKDRMGGDCLWHGCVPTKTLLCSARIAHEMRHADRWAVAPHDPQPDLARVMERVAAVIRDIEPNDSPERFERLGVDVLFGSGRFVDKRTFAVDGRRLTARSFVIATGSRPAIPAIAGLDSVPFLTTDTLFALREAVPRLIVAGAGSAGCEMAQAFRRLGSAVTIVDVAPAILPREDADAAEVVRQRLEAEGIELCLAATIETVARGPAGGVEVELRQGNATRTLHASHLLLAAGRKVNIEDLGFDAAGVRLRDGRLALGAGLTTTNPRIYAIGDAAGGAQFTHVAEHHAGIVLRRALLRMKWTKPSTVVPSCTYTDPEVARVGITGEAAMASGSGYRAYRFAFADIDRARTESSTDGFAKLVCDRKGRLVGATIVGSHAGELIAECTLAIAKRLSMQDLSGVIHAYPTLAQVNRRAADQRIRERLTASSKAWIQRLFRLQGA